MCIYAYLYQVISQKYKAMSYTMKEDRLRNFRGSKICPSSKRTGDTGLRASGGDARLSLEGAAHSWGAQLSLQVF